MKTAQESMLRKITEMRTEQEDLKEHTLNRLDSLDEKIGWLLSEKQQGAHPLSDRTSPTEQPNKKERVVNVSIMTYSHDATS